MISEKQEQALSNLTLAHSRRLNSETRRNQLQERIYHEPDPDLDLLDHLFNLNTEVAQDIRDEVIAEIEYRKYR